CLAVAADGGAAPVGDVPLHVAREPVVAAGRHHRLGHAPELRDHGAGDPLGVEDTERVLGHPDGRAQEIRPRGVADLDPEADVEARRLLADERAIHVEEGRAAPDGHGRDRTPKSAFWIGAGPWYQPAVDSASLVVGIAGGTGSGKTTVAKTIAAALPAGRAAMLELDAYDRDH